MPSVCSGSELAEELEELEELDEEELDELAELEAVAGFGLQTHKITPFLFYQSIAGEVWDLLSLL